MLESRETWKNSTEEERRDLVHIMIQEVGVDVTIKRVQWVKARPDYEPFFSILDGMRQDIDRRFWIERLEASEDNCDIQVDLGQLNTAVEIALPVSHNTRQAPRSIYNEVLHLKTEIAQRKLGDLSFLITENCLLLTSSGGEGGRPLNSTEDNLVV